MRISGKFISTIILAILSGSASTLLLTHLQNAANPHISSSTFHWRLAFEAIWRDFMNAWLIYIISIVVLGLGIFFIWKGVRSEWNLEHKREKETERLEKKFDDLVKAVQGLKHQNCITDKTTPTTKIE